MPPDLSQLIEAVKNLEHCCFALVRRADPDDV